MVLTWQARTNLIIKLFFYTTQRNISHCLWRHNIQTDATFRQIRGWINSGCESWVYFESWEQLSQPRMVETRAASHGGKLPVPSLWPSQTKLDLFLIEKLITNYNKLHRWEVFIYYNFVSIFAIFQTKFYLLFCWTIN